MVDFTVFIATTKRLNLYWNLKYIDVRVDSYWRAIKRLNKSFIVYLGFWSFALLGSCRHCVAT